MSEETIKIALTSLGLTRYEADVYNALVEIGEGSARDLSNHCTVPREKIYYVLKRMEKQGLVKLANKKPIRYIALSPRNTLAGKIDAQRDHLTRIETATEILEKKYDKGSLKIERKNVNCWEILQNVDKTLHQFLSGCNNRLDIILTLEESMSLSGDTYQLLKKLEKDDVEINIYSVLKEVNVNALGKLYNVSNIRVIEEELWNYSIYVADEESGFIHDTVTGRALHFIDDDLSGIILKFLDYLSKESDEFDRILPLLEHGEDPWNINRRLKKATLYDSLVKVIESLIIDSRVMNNVSFDQKIKNAISNIFFDMVDVADLSISESVMKIGAIGSLISLNEMEIDFDENLYILTFRIKDDKNRSISSAVSKGIDYPLDIWSLLVLGTIEKMGLKQVATTIIFDKILEEWTFIKKYKPQELGSI